MIPRSPANYMPALPNNATVYQRGLNPRCRPYGPNAFDDCLHEEYFAWVDALENGVLREDFPLGRSRYRSTPWISMPAEGRRFRPIAVAPLTDFQTLGAFNGLDTIVLQEKVPVGYDGVISEVVFTFAGSGFVEGSGDITWRLAADYMPNTTNIPEGRYLRDMGNVIVSLGSLTQPSPIPRGGLLVHSGNVVTVYCAIDPASVVSNGNVICSIAGWYWPR